MDYAALTYMQYVSTEIFFQGRLRIRSRIHTLTYRDCLPGLRRPQCDSWFTACMLADALCFFITSHKSHVHILVITPVIPSASASRQTFIWKSHQRFELYLTGIPPCKPDWFLHIILSPEVTSSLTAHFPPFASHFSLFLANTLNYLFLSVTVSLPPPPPTHLRPRTHTPALCSSALLVSSPLSVSQRKGCVIVCFIAAGCRAGEAVFGHRAGKPTWIINMMTAKPARSTCLPAYSQYIYLSHCLTACTVYLQYLSACFTAYLSILDVYTNHLNHF